MKALIMWNPSAGSSHTGAGLREELSGREGYEIRETDSRDEAIRVVAESASRFDVVVAAGGDGTINAVVNGLDRSSSGTPLAVLPLGTCNDLCRTLAVPLDPHAAADLIESGCRRRLDLVDVIAGERRFCIINMATGGNSDRVIKQLDDDVKRSWGPLSYLGPFLDTLSDLSDFRLAVSFDDGPDDFFTVWNVIVGNGRTSPGGFQSAPHANPEDGLLDVILVLTGTALDIAEIATEVVIGDYLEHDRVYFRRARKVRMSSQPAFHFSADGEITEEQPVEFKVRPQAIEVVVGATYSARSPLEPAEEITFE